MDALALLLGRTLVIIAHPDDETVTCGALLQRIREPYVLFCTDGGPMDPYFWSRYGSREAYSQMRQKEARASLAHLGVSNLEFLKTQSGDHIVDQQLFQHLPEAVDAVSAVVSRTNPDVLLTLAYEGSHPDHDSCNFIASIVARRHALPAWEMPLERVFRKGGRNYQTFSPSPDPHATLRPTPDEISRKRQALDAYASQGTFRGIESLDEVFRPLPPYNYARLPHDDVLNYEAWQWPMTGKQVSAAFEAFLNSSATERSSSVG